MIKINLKNEWILWLAMIIPVFAILLISQPLPAELPVHFNMHGEPDGYVSKTTWLFLFPVLNLVLYIVLILLPGIDPKGSNYGKFNRSYWFLRLSLVSLFSILFLFTMAVAINHPLGKPKYLFSILFLFFAVFGNFMKSVKPNFFIGVRTPWTLSSEGSWRKTHSLIGKLWFYGGFLGYAAGFFTNADNLGILMLAFTIITVAIAIICSYVFYKKEQNHE